MDNWIEFFTYTCFIDRDGKFQLTMLHRSSFAPLSRSMGPMLKEEAFHLFTGQSGLTRIIKTGKVPIHILQKYINKWLSTGYDLSVRTTPVLLRDSIDGVLRGDSMRRLALTCPRTSIG
jgi:benzoyl-CoA 2,3-dioxygenase component B